LSGTPDPGAPGEDELPPEEDVDLGEDLEDGDEPLEAEAEPEDEPEPEPPPRQSRRERQQDNWRERALKAEAERDVYRGQAQPRQQPQPDPAANQQRQQAEYERIANLPFEQQAQAYHQMMRNEVAVARLESFDLNDKAEFRRLCREEPAAARLEARVEQILQAQRANGIYQFSREQIYNHEFGTEMRERSRAAATRQRKQGAANVARQTVRPGGQRRGDVAQGGNRTRGEDADMRLLMGAKITDL
jgi:hypothetical protein